MSQSMTVAEAQDQLLETAFELYRIRQRLHHRWKALKSEYENVREYYDAEEPVDEAQPLELEVAVQIEMAIDQLEELGDDLRKTSRLTNADIQLKWRVDQERRRRL